MTTADQSTENLNTARGSCPYLGLLEDTETSFSFASPGNFCHHCKPVAIPSLSQQESYCLLTKHVECPVYCSDRLSKIPREFAHPGGGACTRNKKRAGILVSLTLIGILGAIFAYVYFFKKPVSTILPGAAEASQAASTEIYRSLTEQVRILTEMANAQAATEPAPTSTSTKALLPTASSIPTPHTLDSDIGTEIKLIIHKAISGESLLMYEEQYNTSMQAITAANYNLVVPLWENAYVVIPKGISSPEGLPAFEPYQITDETISVEDFTQRLSIDLNSFLYWNGYYNTYRLSAGEWVLIPH